MTWMVLALMFGAFAWWFSDVVFKDYSEPMLGSGGPETGPWTSSELYWYPPGLELVDRQEFRTEEQLFIEAFWYERQLANRMDDAGLYKDRVTPDAQRVRLYPEVTGFSVHPTGVHAHLRAGDGFTPSMIDQATETLMADVPGESRWRTEATRNGLSICLESRNPLGDTELSSRAVFGEDAAEVKGSLDERAEFLDVLANVRKQKALSEDEEGEVA